MQELKFRNFLPSLLTFAIAVAVSAGCSNTNITPISLPIPLLIIGLFTGYLLLTFLSYPKATTLQIIQLTIVGFFINITVLITAFYSINYFNTAPVSLDSDFIILINPLIPTLSFIFSYITLISIVRFEEIVIESKKTFDQKEKQTEKEIEDTERETIPFEGNKISESNNTVTEEPIKTSNILNEKPKSLYEELYPQIKNETACHDKPQEMEFFFGLTENDIETKKDISLESSNKFTKLEPLPSINLEEQNQVTLKSDTPTKDDNNEYLNFIPTDIRLVETSVPKENESKGKIASIGKLLVNNRDIESIIESNATSASSQSDEAMLNGKTSILSLNSGEEIYEKFNKLKQEFEHIREIALVDKGGFVLASNYEDKTKIHITGALIAGAYHTMQNYLTQISFKHPKRIFFETENSNNFIMKTDDNFLFSIWDKGLKHIDYSDLEGFIENAEISEKELIPLIELNQIKNFSISDITGEIIKSNYNFENSEKLALISSALFENLKVFLININLLKLTRITILNDEEVITIQKINEKIASFVTPTDGLVKISENFQKIEEIY